MRRTGGVRRLYGGCEIPFVVGSGIGLTGRVSTSKIRIKRDSVRTLSMETRLKRSGVVNISTQAMRRTLLTRGRKTSCLKIKTIFRAKAGASTQRMRRDILGRVYAGISVPVITVKKVARSGMGRLSNDKVGNITIVDTVFTRGSVRATATGLGDYMRRVIWGFIGG